MPRIPGIIALITAKIIFKGTQYLRGSKMTEEWPAVLPVIPRSFFVSEKCIWALKMTLHFLPE